MNFYQKATAVEKVWGTMASGILFKNRGEIFLQSRAAGAMESGVWGVPGGALQGTEGMYDPKMISEPKITREIIEKLWHSALREVEEEVGANPKITMDQFAKSKRMLYRKGNFVYITFIVEASDEQRMILSQAKSEKQNEISGHQWFGKGNVPENLHDGLKHVFDVMKNKVNVSSAIVEKIAENSRWTQGQVFIDCEISYDIEILKKTTSDNRVEEIKVETLINQLHDKEVWAEKNRLLSPMMVMTNPTFDHTNISHMSRIRMSDLDEPILIRSKNGRLIDGFHRLAKAFLVNKSKIKAVIVQEEQMRQAIVKE